MNNLELAGGTFKVHLVFVRLNLGKFLTLHKVEKWKSIHT